jgi:hypothetical protein
MRSTIRQPLALGANDCLLCTLPHEVGSEQGAKEPDQAARAYLTVIARNPDAVRRALKPPRELKP